MKIGEGFARVRQRAENFTSGVATGIQTIKQKRDKQDAPVQSMLSDIDPTPVLDTPEQGLNYLTSTNLQEQLYILEGLQSSFGGWAMVRLGDAIHETPHDQLSFARLEEISETLGQTIHNELTSDPNSLIRDVLRYHRYEELSHLQTRDSQQEEEWARLNGTFDVSPFEEIAPEIVDRLRSEDSQLQNQRDRQILSGTPEDQKYDKNDRLSKDSTSRTEALKKKPEILLERFLPSSDLFRELVASEQRRLSEHVGVAMGRIVTSVNKGDQKLVGLLENRLGTISSYHTSIQERLRRLYTAHLQRLSSYDLAQKLNNLARTPEGQTTVLRSMQKTIVQIVEARLNPVRNLRKTEGEVTDFLPLLENEAQTFLFYGISADVDGAVATLAQGEQNIRDTILHPRSDDRRVAILPKSKRARPLPDGEERSEEETLRERVLPVLVHEDTTARHELVRQALRLMPFTALDKRWLQMEATVKMAGAVYLSQYGNPISRSNSLAQGASLPPDEVGQLAAYTSAFQTPQLSRVEQRDIVNVVSVAEQLALNNEFAEPLVAAYLKLPHRLPEPLTADTVVASVARLAPAIIAGVGVTVDKPWHIHPSLGRNMSPTYGMEEAALESFEAYLFTHLAQRIVSARDVDNPAADLPHILNNADPIGEMERDPRSYSVNPMGQRGQRARLVLSILSISPEGMPDSFMTKVFRVCQNTGYDTRELVTDIAAAGKNTTLVQGLSGETMSKIYRQLLSFSTAEDNQLGPRARNEDLSWIANQIGEDDPRITPKGVIMEAAPVSGIPENLIPDLSDPSKVQQDLQAWVSTHFGKSVRYPIEPIPWIVPNELAEYVKQGYVPFYAPREFAQIDRLGLIGAVVGSDNVQNLDQYSQVPMLNNPDKWGWMLVKVTPTETTSDDRSEVDGLTLPVYAMMIAYYGDRIPMDRGILTPLYSTRTLEGNPVYAGTTKKEGRLVISWNVLPTSPNIVGPHDIAVKQKKK